MNFEQLRGFVTVAHYGHFTRAAEQLHVAQPSLSRQIAALEQHLGVELLHRARGNITLTAAGERMLPIARRMLADADAAREAMAELAGLRGGRVRLGATPTLCTSLVAEALGEFHRRYPEVELSVRERGSRSLIAALMEGTLDLALIVTSVASETARAVLERQAILSERLVAVSAAQGEDPFAGATTAGLTQLADLPQVLFAESYDLRVTIDSAFAAAGLTPNVAVEGVEMDAALRFAERGIAIAVVPAMVVFERPTLRATPIDAPEFTRTISIARRSDMTPTHAAAVMRALIQETANQLVQREHGLVTRPASTTMRPTVDLEEMSIRGAAFDTCKRRS